MPWVLGAHSGSDYLDSGVMGAACVYGECCLIHGRISGVPFICKMALASLLKG